MTKGRRRLGPSFTILSLAIACHLYVIGTSSFLQQHLPFVSIQPRSLVVPRLGIRKASFRRNRDYSYKSHRDSQNSNDVCGEETRLVVVGKIIIDKYGDPSLKDKDESSQKSEITVGGGGPQAAWAAAAALAVRKYLLPENYWESENNNNPTGGAKQQQSYPTPLPPKQPVTFVAPIGMKNWSPDKANALDEILLPVLESPPILVTSEEHITPTINIWHDENEIVHWMPLDGSFGEEGADGLWQVPTAPSILKSIENYTGDISLHCILESGSQPTGKGLDASLLFDSELMKRISTIGIEPIVFPEEKTGVVSEENSMAVLDLVRRIENSIISSCEEGNPRKSLIVTPDRPCYDATFKSSMYSSKNSNSQQLQTFTELVVRDGANGSFTNEFSIPCANLRTSDGLPVNPTGAGNAYSAGFFACRAMGDTVVDASALATAIGAAVCEHEHLPSWSWEVLERIAEAACEVRQNVRQKTPNNSQSK